MKRLILILVIIVLSFSLLLKSGNDMWSKFRMLIRNFEGFSASPYWDVSRWSIGYGTIAPGDAYNRSNKPDVTYTREQADQLAIQHAQNDYYQLKRRVKVDLNSNQWAALLSLSYNAGIGAGLNVADSINAKDQEALEYRWKAYNKVTQNGVKVESNVLKNRRAKEWKFYNSISDSL